MFHRVTTFQKYSAGLFPVLSHVPRWPSDSYQSIINKLRNLTSGVSRGTSLVSSFLDAPVLSIKFRRGKLLSSFVPGSHSGPRKDREDFSRTTWLFLLFHAEKEQGTRVLASGRAGFEFCLCHLLAM